MTSASAKTEEGLSVLLERLIAWWENEVVEF